MKTMLFVVIVQIVTFLVALYWIDRMSEMCDEAQDRQFKAEMELIELRFKMLKMQRTMHNGIY